MKTNRFLLAAIFALAITFTFSCSGGDDGLFGDSCPNAVTSSNTVSCGGQTYRTVKIGEQVWMAENLNYNASGSKCYGEGGVVGEIVLSPDEIQAYCDTYGRLYTWTMALTACPSGWHLPNDNEWGTLRRFAGGSDSAATKLKAESGWSENGTDAYGFSALPGGYGTSFQSGGMPASLHFKYAGTTGQWWSTSYPDDEPDVAYYFYIFTTYASLNAGNGFKVDFFSVRCVKDE